MKKITATAVLVLISALTAGAERKSALVINKTESVKHAYNISEGIVMKHQDDKLVMCLNGKSIGTYDIYDRMKITFEEKAESGDANNDKNVTMADANTVVNLYLGSGASYINITAADTNGDGEVTMADANAIVNAFLGQ